MTLLSDSKRVRSIIELDAAVTADQKPMKIIVFDLVLYHGHWSENLKHGRCEHFITYRNYYVTKLATSLAEEKKNHKLTNQFPNASVSLNKYEYPGHTTVEAILKEAQLLSGCFFSGHWEKDYLSRGSLFYFHRLFCLHFNGEVPEPDFPPSSGIAENTESGSESSSKNGEAAKSNTSSNKKWLDGEVTYFDCRTASHFTVTLDNEEDVVNGVWNMGCLPTEKGKLRRLPQLTKQIRSNIDFNKLFDKQDSFIDVKDG